MGDPMRAFASRVEQDADGPATSGGPRPPTPTWHRFHADAEPVPAAFRSVHESGYGRQMTQSDPSHPADAQLGGARSPHITRGIDLSALMESLVDSCVESLGAERGTLYLVDGARKTLTSIVAHLPELQQIHLSVGQGIAGTVAASGLLLNVPHPRADERFDATFDRLTGFQTRSLLAVPVFDSRGEPIGVLQILNAKTGAFSPEDEHKALSLAGEVGRLLESTSLYVNLKSRGSLAEPQRQSLAFHFNQIIGESDAMRQVYRLVEKAGNSDATVLIQGESGTGKELIARAFHVNSSRRDKPFIKVDCTTLPENLIENELFGHEKGAFTGADKVAPGKFEVANGGTLFIDEIGELPLRVQGKLLRALQDREFERIGGTKTIRTDIRVVCATHRDLVRMVDEGSFREDLYYRVRVIPVQLPPLRERGEADLLRLIEHFVETFSRRHKRKVEQVTTAALDRIKAHPFPGNIRELENSIESAVVLCDDGVIDACDVQFASRTPAVRPPRDDVRSDLGNPEMTLSELEREHIRLVLEAVGGNQSEAARRLGIGRNTLARKLSGEE